MLVLKCITKQGKVTPSALGALSRAFHFGVVRIWKSNDMKPSQLLPNELELAILKELAFDAPALKKHLHELHAHNSALSVKIG